jgi:hypothetical protein
MIVPSATLLECIHPACSTAWLRAQVSSSRVRVHGGVMLAMKASGRAGVRARLWDRCFSEDQLINNILTPWAVRLLLRALRAQSATIARAAQQQRAYGLQPTC